MNRKSRFDVIVFGCGPAGATVARCLAALGHSVCVVQREQRIATSDARWETLSPGALELLRLHHREAWPKIERLLISCQATVLWTHDDGRTPIVHTAALVDRNELDRVLRTSAVAAGALPCDCTFASSSRFTVDAGGRASAIPSTRVLLAPRTVALSAHVAGAEIGPRGTRVESLADGWLWAGRSDKAYAAVTLFLSPHTVRAWRQAKRPAAFLDMLRGSSLFGGTGSAPRLVSNITARDSTPALRAPITTNNVLRVGDAALALDPLCGQGLQHALVSAAQAATVLHTLLVREGSSRIAREFCLTSHAESVREHVSACKTFYRRQNRHEGDFWRERASEELTSSSLHSEAQRVTLDGWMNERLVLSRHAFWKDLPVIAREFIEHAPALMHPSLSRPIAYLEGLPAIELLSGLRNADSGRALLQIWRSRLPEAASIRALQFLLRRGVVHSARRTPNCEQTDGSTAVKH